MYSGYFSFTRLYLPIMERAASKKGQPKISKYNDNIIDYLDICNYLIFFRMSHSLYLHCLLPFYLNLWGDEPPTVRVETDNDCYIINLIYLIKYFKYISGNDELSEAFLPGYAKIQRSDYNISF